MSGHANLLLVEHTQYFHITLSLSDLSFHVYLSVNNQYLKSYCVSVRLSVRYQVAKVANISEISSRILML